MKYHFLLFINMAMIHTAPETSTSIGKEEVKAMIHSFIREERLGPNLRNAVQNELRNLFYKEDRKPSEEALQYLKKFEEMYGDKYFEGSGLLQEKNFTLPDDWKQRLDAE